MVLVKVAHGPAIRDHVAGEPPILTQDISQQSGATGTRLAVGAVVSGHHAVDSAFRHQREECRQVGFIQVFLTYARVEAVAQTFRPAVDGEVLGRGHELQVVRVVTLQTLY